jgi:hypothetical protein
MVENIKDIISLRKGEVRVLDKHVAHELELSANSLGTCIARDKPPLKEILLFCARWRVDVKSITIKKNC